MRSNLLLHPIAAWRQHERLAPVSARPAKGRAGRRRGRTAPPRASASRAPAPVAPAPIDLALARGRDAGGPVDEACYPCSCGYFFIAPVSANVTCPHCGATQAW